MARDTKVLCLCCNRRISRDLERIHRQRASKASYTPFQNSYPSQQAQIGDSDLDDDLDVDVDSSSLPLATELELETGPLFVPSPSPPQIQSPGLPTDVENVDDPDPVVGLNWMSLRASWAACTAEPSSDEDDGSDSSSLDLSDGDVGEFIDWNKIIEGLEGLTAWDKLGEAYRQRVVELDNRLSSYDLSLLRAFAYKLDTHISDTGYNKLPFAFPQDPPLPSIAGLRSRMTFLSGFQPETYHCCINSCMCYTGPYNDDVTCPYCDEPRYHANGRPRRIFTYLPLIPRLISLFTNRRTASLLLYRHNFKHEHGKVQDVFDGQHYQNLRRQHVTVDGKKLHHKFFDGHRDIAIGLSTDGFAPFKRRRNTAWPLLIFLYNLPPDLRFLVGHYLGLGVIPGPNKPKNFDSFMWPFVQEMLQLAHGVSAFDILESRLFLLRAYLILVFGDMPAVSMVMRMKGHNGIAPCRMCAIKGIRIPNSRGTTHYVPLNQSAHPAVHGNPDRVQVYQPDSLPLRTHSEFMKQAAEVDSATTLARSEALSKEYGIKGTPLLSQLSSLSFPHSFPHDFMHLIWENNVDNLISHWSGSFKGLDDGVEDYQLSKTTWEAIGESTAAAGATIPSAYGSRVPNIATNRSYCSAEMIAFWAMYIAPVLLQRYLTNGRLYKHFLRLIHIVNLCLQFEITAQQVDEIRKGCIAWVKEYEDLYYQHDLERLSACPVTIHALLHIADSIDFAGPVWCYWAFPMERYCSQLQPGITSRRFPYASLDRYVTEVAQLTQVKITHNLFEELSLKPLRGDPRGSCRIDEYPSCMLLPPKAPPQVQATIEHLQSIVGAVATRYNVPVSAARLCVRESEIEEWGKFRRVDSTEGDTFRASSLGLLRDDSRDASFVRYEMLIDKFANQRRRQPEYILQTFYGQLQHIYVLKISEKASQKLKERPPKAITIILAGIRSCKLDNPPDPALGALDIHFHTGFGAFDVVDVTTVQSLVGRFKVAQTDRQWAIIDRSGVLARAVWDEDAHANGDDVDGPAGHQ